MLIIVKNVLCYSVLHKLDVDSLRNLIRCGGILIATVVWLYSLRHRLEILLSLCFRRYVIMW